MFRTGGLYRHLLARRVYLLDAVLALLMVLIASPLVKPTGSEALDRAADRALVVWWIFSAAMIVGLLARHRWPLAALTMTSIGAAAHALVRAPYGPAEFFMLIDLAVPITLYTLTSRRSRRLPMVALGILMIAVILVSLFNQRAWEQQPTNDLVQTIKLSLDDLRYKILEPGLTMALALALAYALGAGTRSRNAHLHTLEQRAKDLQREQHQRIALATATERNRIGRDLHDVVAHSLSVMVAQAQAALAAQHRHPERTTQAMREIVAVGRDSLAEMRRLVGAFGPAPASEQGLAPPVGIAALPALVERIHAAGVPVQFAVSGPQTELPAGVDLSAYRIVQEALTNTLKHAGAGARASVRLVIRPEYVEIEATDDGAGRPAGPPTEPGNGLRGIAERVNLLGGTLAAGPGEGKGFAIRVRLPIAPAGPRRTATSASLSE